MGKKGEEKKIKFESHALLKTNLEALINAKLKEGYDEIMPDEHYTLAVTFTLPASAHHDEMHKKLKTIITDHFGWTGNGRCDEHEVGKQELTLYATVVEPYVGAKTLVEELKNLNITDSYKFKIMKDNNVIHHDYKLN